MLHNIMTYAPPPVPALAPPATIVDVRTQGALGDGTNDDGAAIQAAIDAADGEGGGRVYLPAGTFLVGQPIFKPRSVELIGAGAIPTTIKADWEKFPLTMDVEYRTAHDDPTPIAWTIPAAVLYTTDGQPNQGGLRGVTIDGSRADFIDPGKRAAANGVNGYYILTTANQYIYDVTVVDCEHGFHFDGTQNWRCIGIRTRDCAIAVAMTNMCRVGRFFSWDSRKTLRRDLDMRRDPALPGYAHQPENQLFPNQIVIIGGVFEAHPSVPDTRDCVILADGPDETNIGGNFVRQCDFINCVLVGTPDHEADGATSINGGANATNMRAIVELRGGARNFNFVGCMFNPRGGTGVWDDGVPAILASPTARVKLSGCSLSEVAAPHVFEQIDWDGSAWSPDDGTRARVDIVGGLHYEGSISPSLGPIAHEFVLPEIKPGAGSEVLDLASLDPREGLVAVSATDEANGEALGHMVVHPRLDGTFKVLDVWDSRGNVRATTNSFEWRFSQERVPGGPDGSAGFFALLARGQKNRPDVRIFKSFGVPRPTRELVMGEHVLDNAGTQTAFSPVTFATLPAGARDVSVELHLSEWDDGGAGFAFQIGDGTTADLYLSEADVTLGNERVFTFTVPDATAAADLVANVTAARAVFDWRIRYAQARGQFVG